MVAYMELNGSPISSDLGCILTWECMEPHARHNMFESGVGVGHDIHLVSDDGSDAPNCAGVLAVLCQFEGAIALY